MFGLPSGLARPLSRRMRAVNAELDRIAAHYGTVHWDASTDPETYDRRNWSVDRLHPNERGHRLIACRLWDLLEAAGVPVAERPGSEPTGTAPTRRDDALWMATKGTRWFLRRSVDLIPYMLFMAAREALVEPSEWPVTPMLPSTAPGTGLANTGLASTGLANTGPGGPRPDVKGAPLAGDAQTAEPVAE
jgi:hypothetical protein